MDSCNEVLEIKCEPELPHIFSETGINISRAFGPIMGRVAISLKFPGQLDALAMSQCLSSFVALHSLCEIRGEF